MGRGGKSRKGGCCIRGGGEKLGKTDRKRVKTKKLSEMRDGLMNILIKKNDIGI